jgi:hypothetical protein
MNWMSSLTRNAHVTHYNFRICSAISLKQFNISPYKKTRIPYLLLFSAFSYTNMADVQDLEASRY